MGKDRKKCLMKRGSYIDSFKRYQDKLPGECSDHGYFPAMPRHRVDEDEKWLRWIQKQFEDIAGDDGEIDLDEFKGALGVKKSFFAERFFALFDQDKSGSIELQELMDGLHMLTKGSPKQKLKFLFDVYDVDGSGTIEPDELKTVLRSCMEESSIQLPEEKLQELTDTLFNAADEDGSGEITFDELVGELEKHPGVLENLTISAASWLKPPAKKKKASAWPRYLTKNYILNNVRKVVFYIVYLLINLLLCAVSIYRYRDANWCVIVARCCGMCLNFNCAFIVVLMLRHTLTFIRSTPIGPYLPLDQSISIHKLVGVVIFVQSVLHTLAHFGNIGYVTHDDKDAPAYWEFLFTLKSKIGYVGPGFAYLSGIVLIIVLAVMVICSMSWVRRGGHFQVFYWTHMLYVFFWLFLILHGPIFWYFFIIPGIIFVIESIAKSKPVKLARYGRIHIREVNLLPSGVTHLVISKPARFSYMPGDYVFINIPVIADYEWHPFTISSAPEHPDVFWLHIRSAGHWTGKLYEYFKNYEPMGNNNNAFTLDMESDLSGKDLKFQGKSNKVELTENGGKFNKIGSIKEKPKITDKHKLTHVECFIDGPYGTATREIFETEHAVLIGSGIGVTPYASILQSVMFRYQAMRRQCPMCEHVWFGQVPSSVMKLKKVDFIWINRNQNSFEWFVSLLAKIEMQQAEIHAGHVTPDSGDGGEKEIEQNPTFDNFIDMQMFITSALSKNDMKGMALQMAMEMMHKDGGKDVITGLKTRTQPGRPKWAKVFSDIDTNKKGKVKVFFCGAPVVGKQLKTHCEDKGFEFGKENF